MDKEQKMNMRGDYCWPENGCCLEVTAVRALETVI